MTASLPDFLPKSFEIHPDALETFEFASGDGDDPWKPVNATTFPPEDLSIWIIDDKGGIILGCNRYGTILIVPSKSWKGKKIVAWKERTFEASS